MNPLVIKGLAKDFNRYGRCAVRIIDNEYEFRIERVNPTYELDFYDSYVPVYMR